MRIIAGKTLKEYRENYPEAEQRLISWYRIVFKAEWSNHNELKGQFGSASVLNEKRIVFNIPGNKYRLLVHIEYRMKIVFLVWFGTHKQYDKIDAKTINYVNAGKK